MKTEVATLAGGCFWGVEELFRRQPGVLSAEAGYTGGQTQQPTYTEVKTSQTGHAEAIRIVFDSEVTSFESLLLFFFKMHDPTTTHQQGNDLGSQYRSAIFYHNPLQAEIAQKVIARVNRSNAWGGVVVTEVSPAGEWWKAEDFHQNYLQKNPEGYTCHFVRNVEF